MFKTDTVKDLFALFFFFIIIWFFTFIDLIKLWEEYFLELIQRNSSDPLIIDKYVFLSKVFRYVLHCVVSFTFPYSFSDQWVKNVGLCYESATHKIHGGVSFVWLSIHVIELPLQGFLNIFAKVVLTQSMLMVIINTLTLSYIRNDRIARLCICILSLSFF